MDVINRFLSYLDPDFYYLDCVVKPHEEISRSVIHVYSEDEFKSLLPSKLGKYIFSFLSLNDLKNCRLVCHYWNESTRTIFKAKTCFILDGEKYKWKFFDGTSKNYSQFMSTCTSKFNLWSTMRIRKVSDDQLKFLIANYEFGHAVKHIASLQLVDCQVEWRTLMGFIRHFENLQTLEDNNGQHFLHQPLLQRLKSFFLRNEYRTPSDISKIISIEFPVGGSSFWRLKNIRIIENDNINSVTEEIFSILNLRTFAFDEVELDIGKQTAAIESPHRQTEYWSNILYCLRMKDVKKLTIQSSHSLHIGFSKRFFLYFSYWKGSPGTSFSRLTELTINIKPIQLWQTFQDQFIPFIRTLRFLKAFSIQMMVMRESQEHLLHSLKKAVPKDCDFQFGLIVDDYGGLIAASQIQSAMLHPLYFDHLATLDIVILTGSIIEARELFPYDITLKQKFPHVKELGFSTKVVAGTCFYTFNLNIVVHTFPNLIQLVINDGPQQIESSGKSSSSVVSDQDMQLILGHLAHLQKLDLKVNMMFLTDAGLTGLSNRVVRMVDSDQFKVENCPFKCRHYGFSVSNLKYLRYFSLEGLGTLITDKTAFNAFNGLQYSLKYLKLAGTHKVTEAGQKYLSAAFSSRGCLVTLT